MATAGGSKYFRYTAPKARAAVTDSSDVDRGLKVGQSMGALIGQFTGAINQAKQNAVANQLLNKQFPDTTTTTDTGETDPDPDPVDESGEAITDPDTPIPDQELYTTQTEKGNLQGGVEELKTRQTMAKEVLDNAYKEAQTRHLIAQTEGTGPFAKFAKPVKQGVTPQPGDATAYRDYKPNRVAGGGPVTGTTSTRGRAGQVAAAPVRIGTEPVTDQGQLTNHFDATYGKGSFSKVMSNLDTAKPDGDYFMVGPSGKEIRIPHNDAQTYAKQLNALRLKQGLTPFPVPGEDPSLGNSQTNPYPTTNNLDVHSRPPGSWVRLPDNRIAQVPFSQ